MVQEIKNLLKYDKFDKSKRKSEGGLFDDSCSICMDNFKDGNALTMTPCNHCFHEGCLMGWTNTTIDKILKDRRRNPDDPEEKSPACPNCGQTLIQAAANIENEAIMAIGGLLSSDSKVDQSDIVLEDI
jgi:hypothetical protein